MCSVSMIMDHYWEKWQPHKDYIFPLPPLVSPITWDEIQEFRRLLERAREYDRKHNQPDCELEEKRQRLKNLAAELGVDISFV